MLKNSSQFHIYSNKKAIEHILLFFHIFLKEMSQIKCTQGRKIKMAPKKFSQHGKIVSAKENHLLG